MKRTLGSASLFAFVLVGGLACVLVDNPDYAGGETASETATSTESGGGTSSESTSETSTSASTTDTTDTTETTDGWCPPGHTGEIGCPCNDVDQLCDRGLICIEGLCSAPSNCPAEDPNVLVAFDPMGNEPTTGAHSGNCDLVTTIDPQGMFTGSLSSCLFGNVSKSEFTFGPLALPPDDPQGLIGNKAAAVRLWAVSADQRFMRVSTNTFTVWLAIGPALDSGDLEISDYPLALLPASGDCPAITEPCGASQRKAVQVGDPIVFDGNAADLGGGVQVWVDEARTICGAESYRVALFAVAG